MITIKHNFEGTLKELGYATGLKVFDTALPQNWVDNMIESSKIVSSRKKGIYPYGFVWCYDKSEIFGEPVPLTEGARVYAKFMAINPRVFEGIDW
jgi:hypothetical protein